MNNMQSKTLVKGMYTSMILMAMATVVSLQRQPFSGSAGVTEGSAAVNRATTPFWLFNENVTNPTPQPTGGGPPGSRPLTGSSSTNVDRDPFSSSTGTNASRNEFPATTGGDSGGDSFPSDNGSGIDSFPSASGSGRDLLPSASGRDSFSSLDETNNNRNNLPSPTSINRDSDSFHPTSGNDGNSFPSTSTSNGSRNNIPSPSVVNRNNISFPSPTSGNDRNSFPSSAGTNDDNFNFPSPTGTNDGGREPVSSSGLSGGNTDNGNSFPSPSASSSSPSISSSTGGESDNSSGSSSSGTNVRTVEGRSLQIPGLDDEGFGDSIGKPLRRIRCVGIGVFHNSPSKDRWCLNNCLNTPSFCPPMFCNCQYVD